MHSTEPSGMTSRTASGPTDPPEKPVIAIMGEFSAGKSTLCNLLIGAPSLPVKVTATQLPPVWISCGDAAPYRVDLEGGQNPVDLDDMSSVSAGDTQFIRVFHKSDALELCDLIDMPGISDPNMPPEVWERVAHHADAVIWCTHASQAWRQSEAAVWSGFSDRLSDKSLLLITRFDKITKDRDRQRVVRRIEKETDGLFRGVYPISLTRAMAAGDNHDLWAASGGEAFATALIDLAAGLSQAARPIGRANATRDGSGDGVADNVKVLARPRVSHSQPAPAAYVVPRRVCAGGQAPVRSARPPRQGSGGNGIS